MKKRLKIIIPIILIAAAGFAIYSHFFAAKGSDGLIVSGNIEATETRLSFRIPGVVSARHVDEGDSVKMGQTVAELDRKDQEIAVARASATLANAEAVLAELEAGSRAEEIEISGARVQQATHQLANLQRGSRSQEIESARADLESALSASKTAAVQLTLAKDDFRRFEALYKKNGASQRDFEQYKTAYEAARNRVIETDARIKAAKQNLSLRLEGSREEEVKQAAAALKQAEAEYELTKNGPRKERIDQASAQVAIARESLNQAKQQLLYTKIEAPTDGVVLSKSAEPGEYLNPASTVVTIGDVRHPWLRAYINEKDLGAIKLNDELVVTTDAFPDRKFKGIVRFISSEAEFTPKAVQTFEERVKLMYRIRVDLENQDLALKPGMPADAVRP